jgi:hypothetical protein
MPVLAPVEPFLALIDRIISLLKARKAKRREYFEKIIDPLYAQFKPLGEDYLKLFRRASDALQKPNKRISKSTILTIKNGREQFSDLRSQLRALLIVCAKDSKEKGEKDITEFVEALEGFFKPVFEQPSVAFLLVAELELWNLKNPRAVPEPRLVEFVVKITDQLERSWYEIAGRYMELRPKANRG